MLELEQYNSILYNLTMKLQLGFTVAHDMDIILTWYTTYKNLSN